MKKMFLVLFVVVALSGMCVARAGDTITGTSNFKSNLRYSFMDGKVVMAYKPGRILVTEDYAQVFYCEANITVKMGDYAGGAFIDTELRGTGGQTITKSEATGNMKSNESKTITTKGPTAYLIRYYGYVDYRGKTTAPDIYTCTITDPEAGQ